MVFWLFTVIFLVVTEYVKQPPFGIIALILLGLGLLGLAVSTVYQLKYRRWLKGMATLLVIVISIVSLAVYSIAQFLIAQSEPDEFAKELKIPTNIPMNLPVNMGTDDLRPDSLLKRKVTAKDFQLYNSFQPGLYQFDFWVGKIEKGTLYLKAFEVTQDLALSAESLHERSSVAIYNPTDSVKRFGTTRHFTI